MNQSKLGRRVSWVPRPGLYQCVLPAGTVHIDMFPAAGEQVTPVSLKFGDDIELHEKELRLLRTSEILLDGLLAPIAYFKCKPNGEYVRTAEGAIIKEDAFEDKDHPNLISDDNIFIKIQTMDNDTVFAVEIGGVTSEVTLNRYKKACEDLDTPLSYIKAIDEQLARIAKLEEEKRFDGEPEGARKSLLTERIKR